MTKLQPSQSFTHAPAFRARTPLLVGLVGPSGSGKTFSALRLAAGMNRVSKGKIFGVDTENGRMLHYADKFAFEYVRFDPPFTPARYREVIEYCIANGATEIVIDSMSHEHEGEGGVLEMHDAELDRMAGQDWKKRERMNFTAWIKPKRERQAVIRALVRCPANIVMCFRAKEKIKLVSGKDPENLGWQAIAGDEYVFECTLKCLLPPGCDGTPEWHPEFSGEKALAKLPLQFRETFGGKNRPQLSEVIGEQLARWAAGHSTAPSAASSPSTTAVTAAEILGRYAACRDEVTFRQINELAQKHWPALTHKAELKKARDDAEARVARASKASPPGAEPSADERAEIERLERESARKS